MKPSSEKHDARDVHFARNSFGISGIEFFWGLGLPVIVESTFLQLFLHSLGASESILGLVPALFAAGIALFALVSAYLTSHLVRKRRAVVLTHLLASLPLVVFGLLLLTGGYTDDTVALFLIFYFLYAVAIGVTLPVWQNFLVKIFSAKKTVTGLSVMMIFQTMGRLLGSILILKLVTAFSFSSNGVGALFLAIGSVFFTSSFFFLMVEELPGENEERKDAHNIRTLAAAFVEIVTHKNYMLFLFSFIEAYACVTVISFYANYAARFHGISPAHAAGIFVALVHLGSISSTVVLGWLNVLSLRTKYFISKVFALAGTVLLVWAESMAAFLVVSYLLGLSRGVSLFGYSPGVKIIAGRDDATDYFAASPLIALPVSFGIPYLCGYFLERFSSYGILSYRVMFLFLGLLIMLSMVFLFLTDFSTGRRTGSAA